MLQNWFILMPEISLLSYLAVAALVNRYRAGKTAKTFFTLSKYFLLAALLGTVVFYNLSVFPCWMKNTPYTTLFKVVIYLVAFAWFYLSSKWFLNKNRSSYRFYSLGMTALLLLGILISAQNFLLVAGVVPLLCLINYALLRLHWDEDRIIEMSRLYLFFASLFCLLLWGGAVLLWTEVQSFAFADIYDYYNAGRPMTLVSYAAVGMIMCSLFFMLAVAPFHSWFVGIVSVAILPVCGFITLVPPFAYLACLINSMVNIFWTAGEFIKPALLIFASISLFIGALSANGEKNLRELFAFSSIYHIGFLLFTIVSFNDNSVLSAFAYMMVYILAMAGVYTVFLGLKSRGDYLTGLSDIDGLSVSKPYLSAALLVFMVSLAGIPPMLGFLGRLSVINNLVVEERWGDVVVLLVSMLFMANAYLQVIRTAYFEPLKKSFDRTEKAIYICLFVNLVLVIISTLNPGYLLHDAELILNGIF